VSTRAQPWLQGWIKLASSDAGALVLLALFRVLLHAVTNGQYGFHRDELATVDDARYPAWGYVAYPPLTPMVARLALFIFGDSLAGLRFFASLAQGAALVLTGLMAREFGGRRYAQLLAAVAVMIAPVSVGSGALFQYVAFDYLWWVSIAYMFVRLLRSEDPRWWLGIGAVIGLATMTKYTVAFLIAGIAVGVLLTPARRYLKSPWLWSGVTLAVTMFLPNLLWQARHDYITFDFLTRIHARDMGIGRTDGFLPHQFLVGANVFTSPLWLAGLVCLFVDPLMKRFRAAAWLYAVPLMLFVAARGRDYYLAPAYPMLLAAGSTWWESRLLSLPCNWARFARSAVWTACAVGGVLIFALVLPIAPINSAWWNVTSGLNDDLREEIGWPDLVQTVARIRDSLPAEERARLAILAGNYGEAGAIDLYGPAYGLPKAIGGVNSYWLRGYGDPPPETLIVIGFSRAFAERNFEFCEIAGRTTNRYGVKNEETLDHPAIFVCRRLRRPWPEFWKRLRNFG
jgi:4-amino-4-deoxy-L-arabinose transferase-like glycosyltransferase